MNKKLAKAKHKTTYHKIQEALGNNRHFETDSKIFIIAHGVVYPLRKRHYSSTEEALDAAEEIEKVIWKDTKLLEKFMSNQPKIQSKLLEVLTNEKPIE
jgi:ribosomal protein S18